ncbi:MAG: hypothetical protein P8Z71_12390, partial [Candidatus Sulfobium sp.]
EQPPKKGSPGPQTTIRRGLDMSLLLSCFYSGLTQSTRYLSYVDARVFNAHLYRRAYLKKPGAVYRC